MKKRICCAIKAAMTGLLALCLLTGCTMTNAAYDAAYTDTAKLTAQADCYKFQSRRGGQDSKILDVTFEQMSGVETEYELHAEKAGTLQLQCQVNIRRGQWKLVAVLPGNRLKTMMETSGSCNQDLTLVLPVGTTRIRAVGKSASGEMSLTPTVSKEVQLQTAENDFMMEEPADSETNAADSAGNVV